MGLSAFHPRLFKDTTTTIGTEQTDENIYLERQFRDAVMAWLSNGKPKLFRSETEGNMIVMITGASFTPLSMTQRMVYTMSCTVTEIAEYNLANLIDYNLIPSEIVSNYVAKGEWDFNERNHGNPDPWISNQLIARYYSIYDIPSMKVGEQLFVGGNYYIDVTTSPGNGYPPYQYWNLGAALSHIRADRQDAFKDAMADLNGLPTGFSINSSTGRITGFARVANPPTTASIVITDSKGDFAILTINVGRFYNALEIRSVHETTKQVAPDDVPYNSIQKDSNDSGKSMTAGKTLTQMQQRVTIYADPSALGQPPYEWSAAGLPAGLYLTKEDGIDFKTGNTIKNSCMIEGAFAERISIPGFIVITCTDSLG